MVHPRFGSAESRSDAQELSGALATLAATEQLGQALAEAARLGDCIALDGELGAGKTTLSRALATAWGLDEPAEFASPTYTYLNPYPGRRGEVLHFDFYRVGDEESAEALGLDEQLRRRDALCLVEWASLLPGLVPPGALWLRLTRPPGEASRLWHARGGSPGLRAALQALAGAQGQDRPDATRTLPSSDAAEPADL